jgi:2'-5' RNA ligase
MARVRTFLAIDLGEEARARLISLQEELATIATDVNWVEPDNLHLTLLFLGEVQGREVLGICRTAQRAVAKLPVFNMKVEGAGAFPNARRPRTLWVGIGAGAEEVRAVHDAIEAPLLEEGGYRRETRGYVPHVTLGRVKGEQPDELATALVKHQTWSAGEVTVYEVKVMTSELTRDGPVYTVLGRAKLLAE